MEPAEPLVGTLIVGPGRALVSSVPARRGEMEPKARRAKCLRLAGLLWDRFRWDLGISGSKCDDSALILSRDSLGKPELFRDSVTRVSVSFSHTTSMTWAAMAGPDWSVGIDAAEPDEFSGSYPFHRVFHESEFRTISECAMTAGNIPAAAAFLWSVKEAVSKALGCGFHLIGPREVRVAAAHGSVGDRVSVQARLSGKALERFPLFSETTIDLVSLRDRNMWIAIALIPAALLSPEDTESLGACTINQ